MSDRHLEKMRRPSSMPKEEDTLKEPVAPNNTKIRDALTKTKMRVPSSAPKK